MCFIIPTGQPVPYEALVPVYNPISTVHTLLMTKDTTLGTMEKDSQQALQFVLGNPLLSTLTVIISRILLSASFSQDIFLPFNAQSQISCE